jgi:hypothetical protein
MEAKEYHEGMGKEFMDAEEKTKSGFIFVT